MALHVKLQCVDKMEMVKLRADAMRERTQPLCAAQVLSLVAMETEPTRRYSPRLALGLTRTCLFPSAWSTPSKELVLTIQKDVYAGSYASDRSSGTPTELRGTRPWDTPSSYAKENRHRLSADATISVYEHGSYGQDKNYSGD